MFQKKIIEKYLSKIDRVLLTEKYTQFISIFADKQKQENIRASKEEQYQEGFIRDLFCAVLGYTISPDPNYNIITELKNETNVRTAIFRKLSGLQTRYLFSVNNDTAAVGRIKPSEDIQQRTFARSRRTEYNTDLAFFYTGICFVQCINKGIALSREKILNSVWNYDYYGDARTIDTHVKKLRSKMGDKGNLIKTIWGMGYKFDPDGAEAK